MQPFLEKVSEHIFRNYNEKVSELSIVLPNKRAGLFLKKFLAEKFGKTIWSPKIYSIDEFMTELSGAAIPEPLTLLFEFYHIYKKAEGEKAQLPEEFIRWAPVLLNDFNEIDSYCAEAGQLFNFLNEIRAIESWNPDGRELSGFQKEYLSFWKSLGRLYDEFSIYLSQKKQATQGLAYRMAVQNIQDLSPGNTLSIPGPVLFIGFNALTKAEETIIKHFIRQQKAEIIWDADTYYTENKNQEAGKFLRKNIAFPGFTVPQKLSSEPAGNDLFLWKFNFLGTSPKEIEIIGTPGKVAQAKVAGDILSSISGTDKFSSEPEDFQKTAVVLAEESLLMPMLQSLPEKVQNVNVTMGYPLKNTPLHDFWNSFFRLHENEYSISGNQHFYHKDLVRVLSHPFLSFPDDLALLAQNIIREIKQKNRIYFSAADLQKIGEESGKTETLISINLLFSDWKNNPHTALETAIQLIKFRISEKNLEAEFLACYLEIFHQLQWLIEQHQVISDLRTLRIIFNQVSESHKVPFSGEPLKGLQIMGMLETRTLDFENVILLSANEEVLPSGRSQNSFIPMDVKKQFGLPTYSDRDAIFAYHFYRLIQRAKKVFIIYNNDSSNNSGMGGSEKSRFITQVLEELPKVNPNVKITEKILFFPTIPKNEIARSIEKSEQIIKRLDEISGKGFSPTAFNTYMTCSLDFYFKYIIGLREEKAVEETIEAAAFGDLVHSALHDLYLPFEGKIVSAGDIENRKKDCEKITRNAFMREYSERDISFGKNLLTLKVAEKLIRSFLNKDIEFIQKLESQGEALRILGLEKELERTFNYNERTIRLKGKADRIDQTGKAIRIVDYKTGNVYPQELKIETAEITGFEKQKPKALQLLMYALLYNPAQTGDPHPYSISSGIISMKKLSGGFMPLTVSGNDIIEKETLKVFEQELGKIVEEMYDLSTPFEHNPESKYCVFCSSH